MILLEVAVDDVQGLAAAVSGGAGRVELCAALAVGGLTPSSGLMAAASGGALPVHAMIRPRPGGFCYDAGEIAVMEADIAAAREAGLAGVVFGALTEAGDLDLPAMRRLCAAAEGMAVTLHRAFDLTRDWRGALDAALGLGIGRILTSGQELSAPLGAARLAQMIDHAGGRCLIMPGAGISAATIGALAGLKLREVHASCARPTPNDPRAQAMGFAADGARRADAREVAALRAALDAMQ